jgi:hypothetical protein
MFNEDLLESIARELTRVEDMFAMPDPGYEMKLRELAGKLLDFRENLIEAENMLFWDYDITIAARDEISDKLRIPSP